MKRERRSELRGELPVAQVEPREPRRANDLGLHVGVNPRRLRRDVNPVGRQDVVGRLRSEAAKALPAVECAADGDGNDNRRQHQAAVLLSEEDARPANGTAGRPSRF